MRRKPFFAKPFAWKSMAAAALVAAAVAGIATPAAATYVKAGVLTCNVGPSVGLIITQRKDMTCTFSPSGGATEHYNGTLRKFGLAVGVTGQGVIVWAVLSAVSGVPPRGALAGDYGGASAEASVVVGVGANVLVGGSNSSFALQPLSVEGQIGLDFAVGISSLALTRAP
jgi:hypothetical protein